MLKALLIFDKRLESKMIIERYSVYLARLVSPCNEVDKTDKNMSISIGFARALLVREAIFIIG